MAVSQTRNRPLQWMASQSFWIVLLATPAAAQTFIMSERPPLPRGGVGTFQQLYTYRIEKDPVPGIASFYDDKVTATGEMLRPYDMSDLTCSHPKPSELGQRYKVCREGKCITCRVNDVGPNVRLKRALDMTPAGAAALGITKEMGLAEVTIERLTPMPRVSQKTKPAAKPRSERAAVSRPRLRKPSLQTAAPPAAQSSGRDIPSLLRSLLGGRPQ